MTSQTVDDGENPPVVTTNTYDVRNKLVEVAVQGGNTVQYVYDGDGNRVRETVTDTGGSVTTLYLTDTGNPTGYAQPLEAWTSGTPNSLAATYLIGDRVYGQADGSAVVSYLQADGHGSTRLMTDDDGVVTAAFNYDAFGGAVGFAPASAGTPYLFGGDTWYDAPTGLYIHGNGVRARLGFFFIQRDPYDGNTQDPTSLHKYLYAETDPINGTDPTGLFTIPEILVTTAIRANNAAMQYGPYVAAYAPLAMFASQITSQLLQRAANAFAAYEYFTAGDYVQKASNVFAYAAEGFGVLSAMGQPFAGLPRGGGGGGKPSPQLNAGGGQRPPAGRPSGAQPPAGARPARVQAAPGKPLLGARGTQVISKTVWKGNGGRIDVENPAPGQRAGQVHYQDAQGNKYLYDLETQRFKNAPRSVDRLLDNNSFRRGIQKALTILGDT